MQTKVCTKCHEEKEISEFNKDKSKKFGVTSQCKECKQTPKAKARAERLALVPEGFKFCSKCDKDKPLSEFHKNKKAKFGVNHICKECLRSFEVKEKEARFALVPEGFKICTQCNKERPLTEFSKQKNGRFGCSSICKECKYNKTKEYNNQHKEERKLKREQNKDKHRAFIFKQNYGITLDNYNEMVEEQNGVCAICGQPETAFEKRFNRVRKLSVDHSHETGKVRGLLCGNCNKALGGFKDNINILQKAIDYLKIKG